MTIATACSLSVHGLCTSLATRPWASNRWLYIPLDVVHQQDAKLDHTGLLGQHNFSDATSNDDDGHDDGDVDPEERHAVGEGSGERQRTEGKRSSRSAGRGGRKKKAGGRYGDSASSEDEYGDPDDMSNFIVDDDMDY